MSVRNRILALGSVVLALAVGLILWGTTLTYASQGDNPLSTVQAVGEPQAGQRLDLEKARGQAEALSEDVYNGLNTTKQIIGKTEARNQAIEAGRATAQNNLKQLADRARQAETLGKETLSETDKRVLKHISE